MSELTRDSALEFLADYITNNKINYVGGEFEREDNNERFLLVASKESALKNLTEENQRLTAIATKHATRADELYEALEGLTLALNKEWEHSKLVHEKMELAFEALDKSRIEAEKGDE